MPVIIIYQLSLNIWYLIAAICLSMDINSGNHTSAGRSMSTQNSGSSNNKTGKIGLSNGVKFSHATNVFVDASSPFCVCRMSSNIYYQVAL